MACQWDAELASVMLNLLHLLKADNQVNFFFFLKQGSHLFLEGESDALGCHLHAGNPDALFIDVWDKGRLRDRGGSTGGSFLMLRWVLEAVNRFIWCSAWRFPFKGRAKQAKKTLAFHIRKIIKA